jgi:hypothetical protein
MQARYNPPENPVKPFECSDAMLRGARGSLGSRLAGQDFWRGASADMTDLCGVVAVCVSNGDSVSRFGNARCGFLST